MPRQPRPVIPEVPLHITQRGNNRQICFFDQSDFMVYLDMLRIATTHSHCRLHAYVLMSNHIHLLVTPTDETGPAAMMKSLGENYVRYINRRYERTGGLWEGRYRSCLVQSETYLMVCQRYIELNPIRAGMVATPFHYHWSSYRCNAHGETNRLVTPHELYLRLGRGADERTSAYRALFNQVLDENTMKYLRRATNGGLALGNQAFTDRVQELLKRTPGSDQLV